MIMQKVTVIAAATTNNNIFAGEYFEILPSHGTLDFAFSAGSTGILKTDDIEIDVICGGDAIALAWQPKSSAGIAAAEPTPLMIPDDFVLSCPAMAGDRIICKVRNKHASVGLRLLWAVRFTPL